MKKAVSFSLIIIAIAFSFLLTSCEGFNIGSSSQPEKSYKEEVDAEFTENEEAINSLNNEYLSEQFEERIEEIKEVIGYRSKTKLPEESLDTVKKMIIVFYQEFIEQTCKGIFSYLYSSSDDIEIAQEDIALIVNAVDSKDSFIEKYQYLCSCAELARAAIFVGNVYPLTKEEKLDLYLAVLSNDEDTVSTCMNSIKERFKINVHLIDNDHIVYQGKTNYRGFPGDQVLYDIYPSDDYEVLIIINGDTLDYSDSPFQKYNALVDDQWIELWRYQLIIPDSDLTIEFKKVELNKKILTIELDNGQANLLLKIKPGDKIMDSIGRVLQSIKKEGYSFDGFTSEIPELMPENDLTIKVKWSLNQHHLVLLFDDDSQNVDLLINYGEAISDYLPYQDNYYLYVENLTFDAMPDSDLEMNASWHKLYRYQVDYGSEYVNNINTMLPENLPIPTRFYPYEGCLKYGYDFGGYDQAIEMMPSHDVTIKAIWIPKSYDLVFDSENLDYLEFDTLHVTFGEYYRLPNASIDDHNVIFLGWYINNVKIEGSRWNLEISGQDFTVKSKWQIGYVENGENYINLGMYPQTHISDASLIAELEALTETNELGYYELDGISYAKINATPVTTDLHYSDGSSLKEGVEWFRVDPIRWRVIKNGYFKYILMLDKLLDISAYTFDKLNYSESYLRYYLNTTFYETVFSDSERNRIVPSRTTATEIIYTQKENGLGVNVVTGPVVDYIYILPNLAFEDRYLNYQLTDYAIARGASISGYVKDGIEYKFGKIWLREQVYDTTMPKTAPVFKTYPGETEFVNVTRSGVCFGCQMLISYQKED